MSRVGTEQYMAPEVSRREAYNATADWFSLGVLLYDFVFLDMPARDANRDAIIPDFLPEGFTYRTKNLLVRLLHRKKVTKKPDFRIDIDLITGFVL